MAGPGWRRMAGPSEGAGRPARSPDRRGVLPPGGVTSPPEVIRRPGLTAPGAGEPPEPSDTWSVRRPPARPPRRTSVAAARPLNVMWSLRALERIGDHARNIAEQVIFLVKGQDIRHLPLDKLEAQGLLDE